jgi:hypothetical protein
MGAFLARFLLEEETFGETYSVHRQFLLCYLTGLHGMVKTSMPCHLLLIGQHSSSKSRVIDQLIKSMVPGTTIKLHGASEKADLSSDQRDQNFKTVVQEEAPPSELGIENSNSKKSGKDSQAMTDQASRHRASTTSTDIGWKRLVLDPVTRQYVRSIIQTSLVQSRISAVNCTRAELPPNVASRYGIIEFAQQERAGNYRITSRILDNLPKAMKKSQEAYYNKLRDIHALHSVSAILRNLGWLKTDDTAVRGFVDEVLQLAADKGLPNVSEIRHLLRDLMLTETLSMVDVILALFMSSKSPLADKEFALTDFIALEKMASCPTEAAAFVLTLLSEQYENTSMASSAVLHAINLSFDTPFQAAALNYEKKRSGIHPLVRFFVDS